MKTSDHIKPCNIGQCEAHNRRSPEYIAHINKDAIYIRTDLTCLNEEWTSPDMSGRDLQTYYNDIADMVKKKTGRKMQTNDVTVIDKKTGKAKTRKGSSPIKEGVIVCKADTTMEQIRAYVEKCEKELHIKAIMIFFHKDEGHYDTSNGKTSWSPNFHAHIVWDWMDHETGKSIKVSPDEMSMLQDLLAESLGMERGQKKEITGKEHLNRNDFILAKQESKIAEDKAKVELLSSEIITKEAEIRKLDKENNDSIKQGIANLFGKGKYAAVQKRNDELEKSVPLEKERLKQQFDSKLASAINEKTKTFNEEKKNLERTISALQQNNNSLSLQLESVKAENKIQIKDLEKRICWRDAVMVSIAKIYYKTNEIFKKAIDAIIDFARSGFGNNGKHGDIFYNDEVIAIKSIMDNYAKTTKGKVFVGNWLTNFAELQGNLDDRECERASNEVDDIANGLYDWRIQKGITDTIKIT